MWFHLFAPSAPYVGNLVIPAWGQSSALEDDRIHNTPANIIKVPSYRQGDVLYPQSARLLSEPISGLRWPLGSRHQRRPPILVQHIFFKLVVMPLFIDDRPEQQPVPWESFSAEGLSTHPLEDIGNRCCTIHFFGNDHVRQPHLYFSDTHSEGGRTCPQ